MNSKILSLIVALIIPVQSLAFLELKLGTTANNGEPDSLNKEIASLCGNCGTKSKLIAGLSADAIFKLPVLPVGFGLRYEKLGMALDFNDVLKTSFDYTRIALLLNYRLINKFVYAGPVASYGLADSSKLKTELRGVLQYEKPASTNSSYTAGFEAGVNLLFLKLGGEIGMGQIKATSFKDDAGVQFFDEINYTGSYFKVHAGFSF